VNAKRKPWSALAVVMTTLTQNPPDLLIEIRQP
jgi:hypothetical protein